MTSHRPPPTHAQGTSRTGWPRPVIRTLSAQGWGAWGALAVLLFAFSLLYSATLDNGLRPGELAGGDLITHQYAQVQGRPSNAPGYPLYTMGGWAWFRLGRLLTGPHSNPIPILSSYSTFWALLALGLLYRLILEVTADTVIGPSAGSRGRGGNWPVALLVSAFYGVTYFFWYYAVTTEQYASAVAWTLAVFLLAFRWERTRRDGCLLAIAFLCGVGLAHMVTTLLVMPPLLWLVLRTEPKLARQPRLMARAAGLAVLPLLSYAYVYLGGAQHPDWRGAGQWDSTWQWFWRFIATQQGRSELTWSLTPLFTREFPSLIWGELTLPGLLAGLAGLAAVGRGRGRRQSWRQDWRLALSLYAALGIYLAFCWIDRQGNWFQVIMPAYALLAVGIAAGADWVWRGRMAGQDAHAPGTGEVAGTSGAAGERLKSLLRRAPAARRRTALILALAAMILYRGLLSLPRANAHNRPEDTGLTPGWQILADDPPPGTPVLGAVDEALALNYLTQIWGQRPDVRSVTSDQARALVVQQQPVAITLKALPLVASEVHPEARYRALGRTLVGIQLTPWRELPAWADRSHGWGHLFGTELRLAGGRVSRNRATGEMVVLLAWQAVSTPTRDWSISVRLTRQGAEIAQVDYEHPIAGAYPTSRWSPGEIVPDAYAFPLPSDTAPDGLTVIVYRRASDGSFVNLDAARLRLP